MAHEGIDERGFENRSRENTGGGKKKNSKAEVHEALVISMSSWFVPRKPHIKGKDEEERKKEKETDEL